MAEKSGILMCYHDTGVVIMSEVESEHSYGGKGMDMLHGPLLKKIVFSHCRLQSAATPSWSACLLIFLSVFQCEPMW